MSPASGGGGDPSAKGGAPGGAGAVLGFRVIRYSGVQGVALVISNMLQLATIGVVAGFLGAADLGRYSLLLFLGALVTMAFGLAVKPGTIRRTFGGGDEDDEDDDDDEEEVSGAPKRSLGAGLMWSIVLGLAATALVVALREPISDLLFGGDADTALVLWAGLLGGTGVLFRVGSICLWFERRPSAFLIAEVARPLVGLALMTALLVAGGGLADAVAGVAVGTGVAALLTVILLRGSFVPNLWPSEVVPIVKAAGRRVPIVSSLWTVQNADVFLLSRAVDATDLGIYTLAARLGLVVSFLPQGFRVAMRPLRKSAVFRAVQKEYGRPTAKGQLLAYFVLVCISSILIMVLAGELIVSLAPPEFADAAPLVPLTATALIMPPLWRTMNGQTNWPSKSRATFVAGTVGAALVFIGLCLVLAPEIGIYAPPVAMLVAFVPPISYFFIRCQLGPTPIDFPYGEVLRGLLIAVVIGGGFFALPSFNPVLEALAIIVLLGLYVSLLFVFRVVPESHWPAITQMAGSVISGRGDRVNPRLGLRSIDPGDRAELRLAITERLPPEALAAPATRADPAPRDEATELELTEGARLVRVLRLAGRNGGAPVRKRSRLDGGVAEFLFADEPIAVRNASMRALLDQGASADDLRGLEDLVEHLAKVPPEAWEGAALSESPPRTRRLRAGRRARQTLAKTAKSIGKRI